MIIKEGLFSASLDKLSANTSKQTQSVELTTCYLSLAKKLILEFVIKSPPAVITLLLELLLVLERQSKREGKFQIAKSKPKHWSIDLQLQCCLSRIMAIKSNPNSYVGLHLSRHTPHTSQVPSAP
ncbi:hypothetical protein MUK42_34539 [Musa troglodytarum]|uniref:Uncharacterized protein n=1 Tax=Musa troglodytarum TaxID=320322 RepID=A0A9E7G8V4_9LILI|nr:hypothetical protein MUK42_34539 [Musa troglodytarum]